MDPSPLVLVIRVTSIRIFAEGAIILSGTGFLGVAVSAIRR